jgi:hypothetical protein
VIDEVKDRAVRIYFDRHGRPFPVADSRAVLKAFGDEEGAELASYVASILREAGRYPVGPDLVEYGKKLFAELRGSHPELSEGALGLLVGYCTYAMR